MFDFFWFYGIFFTCWQCIWICRWLFIRLTNGCQHHYHSQACDSCRAHSFFLYKESSVKGSYWEHFEGENYFRSFLTARHRTFSINCLFVIVQKVCAWCDSKWIGSQFVFIKWSDFISVATKSFVPCEDEHLFQIKHGNKISVYRNRCSLIQAKRNHFGK